jgi:siroheme synthase
MEGADSIVEDSLVEDSIVQSVIKSFLERSALGHKKYGTTLDRTDLKTLDWIQHAQEELMDGILYLERLKKEMRGKN